MAGTTYVGTDVTLPTFIIIGAAKSGTTSLYRYLEQHPAVFMSPVKETLFFAPDWWGGPEGGGRGVQTLEAYEALFAGADAARAIGEASPQYLSSKEAAARIKSVVPDARLIAILRDPAERAYSAFLHLVRDGAEPIKDFPAALAAEEQRVGDVDDPIWLYREGSQYADQLERYYEHFRPEQLRVYLYEEFAADPVRVTQDALEFVGVGGDFVPDVSLRFNPGGVPRSERLHRVVGGDGRLRQAMMRWLPPALGRDVLVRVINRNLVKPELPEDMRRELAASFVPDIERVEKLLQRDLSAWKP